jgi:hypothetical protein
VQTVKLHHTVNNHHKKNHQAELLHQRFLDPRPHARAKPLLLHQLLLRGQHHDHPEFLEK